MNRSDPLTRTLVASSVVRGAQLGESHGGIYIVNLASGTADCVLDWNTTQIDVQGRGGDRGLRGIGIAGEDVYVLSSEALLLFDRRLRLREVFKNRYLKHCHEIHICDGRAYIVSTGFDAIMVFDLGPRQFIQGYHLRSMAGGLRLLAFDPRTPVGPAASNAFHLNTVACSGGAVYFAGLRSRGLLCIRNSQLSLAVRLPGGTHNAQPFAGGVIFNDTMRDQFCARTANHEVRIPVSVAPEVSDRWLRSDDTTLARPLFARGLCALSERYVAGGHSPSTIGLYDLHQEKIQTRVWISHDVRNAIHGLAVWPFAAPCSSEGMSP